jgi:hypothetical protein
MANNVVIGGAPLSTAPGTREALLVKLDTSGKHVWSKQFASTAVSSPVGMGVAVDGSGDVLFSGVFEGEIDLGGGPMIPVSADGADAFVGRFDADGNHVSSVHLDREPSSPTGWLEAPRLSIAGGDKVILTGQFWKKLSISGQLHQSNGFTDVFLARLKL